METGCTGKSDANSLPAPTSTTDLTENPYGKRKMFSFSRKRGGADPYKFVANIGILECTQL
jgi:hypothetical protein